MTERSEGIVSTVWLGVCPVCNGHGFDPGDAMLCYGGYIPECGHCGGWGKIRSSEKISPEVCPQVLDARLKTTEPQNPV